MTNNKRQPKKENPNNQFSNSEPMTFAQKVEYVKSTEMTNNKQQTAVEWFANQLHRVVSNTTDALTHNHNELLEQAKEKHKKEMINFTTDWYHNGSLLGGEILVSTSVKEHYNKTFGGNND